MSYFSLSLLSLHDYTALYFSNPAFTVVLAWVVLRERVTRLTLVGMTVALVGLPVLTQPPFLDFGGGQEWTSERLHGVGLAMVAALLSGGMEG